MLVTRQQVLDTVDHLKEISDHKGITITIAADMPESEFYDLIAEHRLESLVKPVNGIEYNRACNWQVNQDLEVNLYTYVE